MNLSVVPRWVRDSDRLHERRKPVFVFLRSNKGRPDEFFVTLAEGGFPDSVGDWKLHVAGIWGLPVRLVETHHVLRSGWCLEVLPDSVAVFVALCGTAVGRSRVIFFEVIIAQYL